MASGFTTLTNEHLIRAQVYSRQLKQLLLDDLFAMKYVRILNDFPDGTTFNIPSLGEAEEQDFAEGQAIKYQKMDTGNFTFTIDQYKYSAHSISEKFKRDSYWSADVIAAFTPRQHRVLMEGVETRIFNRVSAGQTPSSPNNINNADHRWVGSGTNETIAFKDFALAKYALHKANVPMSNLIAVVDPSVAFTLETQTNITNLLAPRMWGDIVSTGLITGMQFKYNVFGFDVYVSHYLPTANETITQTGGAARTTTAGVANCFFSAAPGDTLPVVGAFRQMPTVYSEFNKDLQQDEYLTITEYGFKLYRPENMVIVLTDTDQVL
jgi:hypothetical protein